MAGGGGVKGGLKKGIKKGINGGRSKNMEHNEKEGGERAEGVEVSVKGQ
jgi:hypothetical protein